VYLGIEPIDNEMRGIAPGELAMMLGYSHGGKTLVLLHAYAGSRFEIEVLLQRGAG
jgi:hypothetical protein